MLATRVANIQSLSNLYENINKIPIIILDILISYWNSGQVVQPIFCATILGTNICDIPPKIKLAPDAIKKASNTLCFVKPYHATILNAIIKKILNNITGNGIILNYYYYYYYYYL